MSHLFGKQRKSQNVCWSNLKIAENGLVFDSQDPGFIIKWSTILHSCLKFLNVSFYISCNDITFNVSKIKDIAKNKGGK